jgi:hypothetical protein
MRMSDRATENQDKLFLPAGVRTPKFFDPRKKHLTSEGLLGERPITLPGSKTNTAPSL